MDGKYLGEFDEHKEGLGNVEPIIALDLSSFKPNQHYLLEILSISLGLNSGVSAHSLERKDIVGNVWLDGQLLIDNETRSSKVDWSSDWNEGVDKPITWFQARFDLDHLLSPDKNANPVLVDAQGLNRGHTFIHGNDIRLYWLIEAVCQEKQGWCVQSQIKCLESTQRYYHILSDWLMPKNNLITIFDDLGAPVPQSVRLVQRVANKRLKDTFLRHQF